MQGKVCSTIKFKIRAINLTMRHLIFGLALLGWAVPPAVAQMADQASDTDLPLWLSERITPVHYELSQFVDSTSRGIDAFFGTEESQYVNNQSFLRLSNEVRLRKGNSINDTGIRFKLDLPTTQQRLRLILESDANDPLGATRNTALSNNNRLTQLRQFESNNSVFGLERVGNKNPAEGFVNRFGAGIRLRSSVDPYLRYTATRLWKFEDSPWQSNFTGRVTYFDKEGYVTRGVIDLGRQVINDQYYFRFISQSEWSQGRDEITYVNAAELNQRIDNRTLLKYAILFVGDTARSEDLYDRVLQFYLRRDIHKKILYADIVPEWHFPTETNTKPFASLTFRLEMYFKNDFSPVVKP